MSGSPGSAAVPGTTKPKPPALALEAADDEVHLVGQAEAVAAHLDQLAVRRERLELAPEGRRAPRAGP